jgi:hypothetical protein
MVPNGTLTLRKKDLSEAFQLLVSAERGMPYCSHEMRQWFVGTIRLLVGPPSNGEWRLMLLVLRLNPPQGRPHCAYRPMGALCLTAGAVISPR